jgi:glycosyltransferase involved in cell wall biosynthesis
MRSPGLNDLPVAPAGKEGWPWTVETEPVGGFSDEECPPRVSIVIPSLNQGSFIEESIRSVLLQGYPNLELIVIDGASEDGTTDVIRKYERWITYWVSEADRGQSHAINKGLARCTGVYFNWHNADDVLTSGSLRDSVRAFMRYPDVSFVYGYRIVIQSDSTKPRHPKKPLGNEEGFLPPLKSAVSNLKAGLQPGCLMNRLSVIDEGGCDEALHYVMDEDLLLRLSLKHAPLYVARPVVYFREHPEAKCSRFNAQRAGERVRMARNLFQNERLPAELFGLRRDAFASAHRHAWKIYAKAGMSFKTFFHLVLDILYAPLHHWKPRRKFLKRL